jgi:hypothetical protein
VQRPQDVRCRGAPPFSSPCVLSRRPACLTLGSDNLPSCARKREPSCSVCALPLPDGDVDNVLDCAPDGVMMPAFDEEFSGPVECHSEGAAGEGASIEGESGSGPEVPTTVVGDADCSCACATTCTCTCEALA